MVYRSIILSVMVVVCTLQGALAQTSITTSSGTISATAPPSISQSRSATSTGSFTATASNIRPTASSQHASVRSTSPAPTSPASTSPPDHTTEKPTTIPPSEKTCGNISIELQTQESSKNSSSKFHNALGGFFGDSSKYSHVMVSDVTLKPKDERVILSAKLCLVVEGNYAGFIADKIAEDGKIANTTVVEGSVKFTALGVKLTDWKAKGEECKKCSEGGGGPFVIERTCTTAGYSCKGVKDTKDATDCVEYCDSDSSAVAMSGISALILTVGVLLSFSFSCCG